MKSVSYLIVMCLFVCVDGWAQRLRVSGTVTCEREPVAGASVSEVDDEQRILHNCVTDQAGHFVMEVSDLKHTLQIRAEGFCNQEQDMQGHNRFLILLVRKLPCVESQWNKRVFEQTTDLFYGHNGMRNIPQMVTVELMSDSLVTLSIPVAAKNMVEAYPEDHMILFLDVVDNRLLVGLNMDESYPIAGEPDKLGHVVMTINRSHENNYLPGASSSDPIYNYPQFLFRLSELEKLISQSSILSRIAIETAGADNYWILHPDTNFGTNLKKILTRLQKRASKLNKK